MQYLKDYMVVANFIEGKLTLPLFVTWLFILNSSHGGRSLVVTENLDSGFFLFEDL